jgi:predicted dehydrogenase
MSTKTYRVGLVGYGRIAESAHLPAWQALPGVEVVAIADPCLERRVAAVIAAPSARAYENCVEMLRQTPVDCLDICTPPHDHTPSILAGCAAGVGQIVCEKPLAASIVDYNTIADAQAESGSQVYTINSWIQSDLHRLVTAAVAEGAIGDVRHVTLRTLRPDCALGVASWQPRWRTDPSYAGGGIVLDHGWHQLYLMARWIGADPTSVRAHIRTVQPVHAPVEDEAELDLSFPNATGRIVLSWASSNRTNDGEIVGTRGTIKIEDNQLSIRSDRGEQVLLYGERLSDSSYHPEWFQALFAKVRADVHRHEGVRNLREAEMLVSTLFAAYQPARMSAKAVPAPAHETAATA